VDRTNFSPYNRKEISLKVSHMASPGVAGKAQIISSEEAGQRLRRARERMRLKFREVELASQRIADRHGNEEYAIGLSRLSEIENRGAVPSIFRIYSLSTIYRLDLHEVLSWYGINLDEQGTDALLFEHSESHLVDFSLSGFRDVQAPLGLDPGVDLTQTTFLSRAISRWGALPLALLKGLDLKKKRYALVGSEDWSMYPVLRPGALLLINEVNKIPQNAAWGDEWERPIYFLEHRDGYCLGWVHLSADRLVVLSHPSSTEPPKIYLYPSEVDVIGQVVGVAMALDGSQYPTGRRRQPTRNADS
jgi:transcriptional regulator with XRE-family HTH domain